MKVNEIRAHTRTYTHNTGTHAHERTHAHAGLMRYEPREYFTFKYDNLSKLSEKLTCQFSGRDNRLSYLAILIASWASSRLPERCCCCCCCCCCCSETPKLTGALKIAVLKNNKATSSDGAFNPNINLKLKATHEPIVCFSGEPLFTPI